ncbi:hypothetical protein HK100_006987 [Physocladia obscura]|uniref:Uncharacterized protein n=1 Tax=Physocladia obscura TaxID=109957 RepID=A0AAD5XF14_9FUNG|nr:hypothetical protein HK100_006987 [Physocladia obscura]
MEAIQTAGDVSVSVSVSGLGSGVQVQGTSGVTDVAGVSGAHTLKFASPKQFRRRHSIDGRVVGVTGEGDGEREGERRERDAENDTERDAEREGERGLPHLTALFHHAAALANPATILSTAKASITSTDDTFAYPPTSKKRYFSIANNYDAESENDNYQYQNYNQHYNQNYNQDYNHDQDRDSDADTSATNVNVDDQVLAHPPSTIIYLDSKRRVNSFVDLNESVFKQTTSNSPPASLNADERIAAEALHALAATTGNLSK